jgi:hypothetical protein
LLPIIPIPKALEQFFHATRDHESRGAAAEAYQLAVPELNTAFQTMTQGTKDNEKSLTVAGGTYFDEV